MTGGLAWRLSGRKSNAWLAAALACLPAFYLPFLPVSDAFGVTMLLGGVFFLIMPGPEERHISRLLRLFRGLCCSGLIAGLMHLTRADGVLWAAGGITGSHMYLPGERERPAGKSAGGRSLAGVPDGLWIGNGAVAAAKPGGIWVLAGSRRQPGVVDHPATTSYLSIRRIC